jgi:hypothetical protein
MDRFIYPWQQKGGRQRAMPNERLLQYEPITVIKLDIN